MDTAARSAFIATLSAAAPALTPEQLALCADFAAAVVETNQSLNLTRITEPEAMALKHFADSLTLLPLLDGLPAGARVCDLGTGAGFPGVPLRIVRPDLRFTLIDSLRKRLTFIETALVALGITDVALVHARAEDAGRDPAHRERYAVVTARAVAALPKLLPWCFPLVQPGGQLVAMKGGACDDEIEAAEPVAAALGLRLTRTIFLTLPDAEGSQRTLLVYTRNEKPRR